MEGAVFGSEAGFEVVRAREVRNGARARELLGHAQRGS
jgi:hypothetical protein